MALIESLAQVFPAVDGRPVPASAVEATDPGSNFIQQPLPNVTGPDVAGYPGKLVQSLSATQVAKVGTAGIVERQ